MRSTFEPPTTNHQPPERGWIVTSYRYHNGKKLGPYYARHWKVGKKVHKQYIKPEEVERVKAQCQAHRKERAEWRAKARAIVRFVDNYDFMTRMDMIWERGKEPREDQLAYLQRLLSEGWKSPAGPSIG